MWWAAVLHFIAPDLYDAHVHHHDDSDNDDSDGEDDFVRTTVRILTSFFLLSLFLPLLPILVNCMLLVDKAVITCDTGSQIFNYIYDTTEENGAVVRCRECCLGLDKKRRCDMERWR
jgi:hypothetical protein